MLKSLGSLTLVATALIAIVGCTGNGRPTARAKGKVTINGAPVPMGTILIHSEDGLFTRNGRINAEGGFDIPDAPIGKVTVTLDFPSVPEPFEGKKKKPARFPEAAKVPEVMKSIPTKYRDVAQSGLVYTIEKKGSTLDIQLQSEQD